MRSGRAATIARSLSSLSRRASSERFLSMACAIWEETKTRTVGAQWELPGTCGA